MGYFPNGTDGMRYEEQYCSKCIHCPDYDNRIDCPVLLAHSLYNYDEYNNPKSILHILIPRDGKGFNEQCAMFVEKVPVDETPNIPGLI